MLNNLPSKLGKQKKYLGQEKYLLIVQNFVVKVQLYLFFVIENSSLLFRDQNKYLTSWIGSKQKGRKKDRDRVKKERKKEGKKESGVFFN